MCVCVGRGVVISLKMMKIFGDHINAEMSFSGNDDYMPSMAITMILLTQKRERKQLTLSNFVLGILFSVNK